VPLRSLMSTQSVSERQDLERKYREVVRRLWSCTDLEIGEVVRVTPWSYPIWNEIDDGRGFFVAGVIREEMARRYQRKPAVEDPRAYENLVNDYRTKGIWQAPAYQAYKRWTMGQVMAQAAIQHDDDEDDRSFAKLIRADREELRRSSPEYAACLEEYHDNSVFLETDRPEGQWGTVLLDDDAIGWDDLVDRAQEAVDEMDYAKEGNVCLSGFREVTIMTVYELDMGEDREVSEVFEAVDDPAQMAVSLRDSRKQATVSMESLDMLILGDVLSRGTKEGRATIAFHEDGLIWFECGGTLCLEWREEYSCLLGLKTCYVFLFSAVRHMGREGAISDRRRISELRLMKRDIVREIDRREYRKWGIKAEHLVSMIRHLYAQGQQIKVIRGRAIPVGHLYIKGKENPAMVLKNSREAVQDVGDVEKVFDSGPGTNREYAPVSVRDREVIVCSQGAVQKYPPSVRDKIKAFWGMEKINWKGLLNEIEQAGPRRNVSYTFDCEGGLYRVRCCVGPYYEVGDPFAKKKEAEQDAARKMVERWKSV